MIWVAQGVEDILDEDDLILICKSFSPAQTRLRDGPARFTVPVPDVLQYRDQLEEINLLTGRIHALSDALEVKGFYPAGGGEIADAVQTAIRIKTPGDCVGADLSNWAAFGGIKGNHHMAADRR